MCTGNHEGAHALALVGQLGRALTWQLQHRVTFSREQKVLTHTLRAPTNYPTPREGGKLETQSSWSRGGPVRAALKNSWGAGNPTLRLTRLNPCLSGATLPVHCQLSYALRATFFQLGLDVDGTFPFRFLPVRSSPRMFCSAKPLKQFSFLKNLWTRLVKSKF